MDNYTPTGEIKKTNFLQTKDWLVGWLVGLFVCLFYGVSTIFGSFNAELSNFDKSFEQLVEYKFSFFVYTQSNVKTVLFQTLA